MISLSGQLLHCYVFTVPILACFVGLHSASRATGSIFLERRFKQRHRETHTRQTHNSDYQPTHTKFLVTSALFEAPRVFPQY